jgi:nucleoside-diphosphate kinase
MIRVSCGEADRISAHYPSDPGWLSSVGQKTLEDYSRNGIDPIRELGTNDPVSIGAMIKTWLSEYLLGGPIVPMVVEGNRAVSVVRKMVGATVPATADPGTIRGDYSTDSPDTANQQRRPIQNLVHASGTVEEAAREIALWFD